MTASSFPVQDGSTDENDELNEHVHDPGDPDGLVAAEEQKRWQEVNLAPMTAPQTVYKPKKLWPKLLVTIIVIVVAAFGSYWFGSYEAGKGKDPKKAQHTRQQSQSAAVAANQVEQYNSTNYSLSFNHLKSWAVTDTTTKLTVVSPTMRLSTVTGAKTNVHVVVTIQNTQTSVAGFPSGGAVAALTSDDLTYTQPSPAQRAQSYLSYLSYSMQSGLDALYVTGNNGYQQGQAVPMSDIIEGNPLIGIAFEACSTNSCTTGNAVTLSASSWKSSTASKDVVSLIESIIIQD